MIRFVMAAIAAMTKPRWEVLDAQGKIDDRFYRFKDAKVYVMDMNKFGDMFENSPFTIRRRKW